MGDLISSQAISRRNYSNFVQWVGDWFRATFIYKFTKEIACELMIRSLIVTVDLLHGKRILPVT